MRAMSGLTVQGWGRLSNGFELWELRISGDVPRRTWVAKLTIVLRGTGIHRKGTGEVSDFRFRISGFGFQVSGFRFPVSIFWIEAATVPKSVCRTRTGGVRGWAGWCSTWNRVVRSA